MKLITESKVFATGICTLIKSRKKFSRLVVSSQSDSVNAQWHLQSIDENRHEIL